MRSVRLFTAGNDGLPTHESRRRYYDVVFYMPSLGPLLSMNGCASGGGAETQIWLLARGLAKRGCSVCAVVSDTPGGVPTSFDGVDVRLRPPWQGGRGWRGRIAELAAVWRAIAPLETNIVVQRTAAISTGLVAGVAKARRRRFVFSSANVVDFDFESLSPTSTELRLFNLGIRLADTIVVQTHEQAVLCREKFGRAAVVVRSLAEPASPRSESPDAFLWVGRLVGYKHPHAYLKLARALPEARFRMVGSPSSDDPRLCSLVEQEARELPNLELLTPRSRSELLQLYDHAVAIVNTAEYEGMPNVFLEAWARGIPALALAHDPDGVIATHRLGGFAEGSKAKFVTLARQAWLARSEQEEVAARCREYVHREHSEDAIIGGWLDALGLDPPRRGTTRFSSDERHPRNARHDHTLC